MNKIQNLLYTESSLKEKNEKELYLSVKLFSIIVQYSGFLIEIYIVNTLQELTVGVISVFKQ